MITQSELKEYLMFNYDEGRFYWIVSKRKGFAGKQAGGFDIKGYGQLSINGKNYKEHRLVWLYHYGKFPENQIDHIDHDKRNNRIQNLRVCTNQENQKNKPIQVNNKFGYTGIDFYKKLNKFRSTITINYKQINLGIFENLEDAIKARIEANKTYGFHENHGKGFVIPKKRLKC